MSDSLENPFRGAGLAPEALMPIADATAVKQLLSMCPAYSPTPLRTADALAQEAGVARIWVKD